MKTITKQEKLEWMDYVEELTNNSTFADAIRADIENRDQLREGEKVEAGHCLAICEDRDQLQEQLDKTLNALQKADIENSEKPTTPEIEEAFAVLDNYVAYPKHITDKALDTLRKAAKELEGYKKAYEDFVGLTKKKRAELEKPRVVSRKKIEEVLDEFWHEACDYRTAVGIVAQFLRNELNFTIEDEPEEGGK